MKSRYWNSVGSNFMFNGNSLTDYTSLFSPNDFKKNDDTIHKYFGQ